MLINLPRVIPSSSAPKANDKMISRPRFKLTGSLSSNIPNGVISPLSLTYSPLTVKLRAPTQRKTIQLKRVIKEKKSVYFFKLQNSSIHGLFLGTVQQLQEKIMWLPNRRKFQRFHMQNRMMNRAFLQKRNDITEVECKNKNANLSYRNVGFYKFWQRFIEFMQNHAEINTIADSSSPTCETETSS